MYSAVVDPRGTLAVSVVEKDDARGVILGLT